MAHQAITLVFTDVVGSSAAKRAAALGSDVTERDRAYLEGIQAKHLRLVRGAVAEHRGKEIMTMGDSFFLTFEDPLDALRCCAAIQQQLAAQPISTVRGPLKLRIGIHVGTPEFFENSWHGTDVDIASRAQSAASSEQIIVTDAARERMGNPPDITLRPLGTFPLKGVGDVKLWDADYDRHGRRRAGVTSRQAKRTRFALALAFSLAVSGFANWLNHLSWDRSEAKTIAATAPAKSAEGNSIIVANIENKTGDSVFDNILTQAFTIQLQQSPVLNLISGPHLRQSLQYLGKSPDAPLTPDVARQIGMREGIKAYLTGSISKLGHEYLIIANAVNTGTGDPIASEQAQAPDEDHVLDALSTVAATLRTHLGESIASIQKLDTPLMQATTPSLAAFRAFALGDVEHAKGNDIPNAETLYRQALDLDPQFAMAWTRLGTAYWNSGETGKAVDCFTRGFRLSKNVSEREKFNIQSVYYTSVTGEVPKAIGCLELACQTYPLDGNFFTLLGNAKGNIGQLEASLVDYRKALALAPGSAISNFNYLSTLTQLDRFPEALSVFAKLKSLGVKSTSVLGIAYAVHLLTGDTAGMAEDIAATQERADAYELTFWVAIGHEFQGRYGEAEETWKRAAAQAAAQGAYDTEASDLLALLSGRALAGFDGDPGPELKAALALDGTKQTLINTALTAALCHQPEIARPVMAKLASGYPDDTVINQVLLPECRAALALGAHQPEVALKALEGSEAFDLISEDPYLRGLAYLDLRNGPRAVEAFRAATRFRGTTIVNSLQDYGQAQMGLARAYVLCGNTASAKKAYETLFVTWKDADSDLPQFLAAKKEYAALK